MKFIIVGEREWTDFLPVIERVDDDDEEAEFDTLQDAVDDAVGRLDSIAEDSRENLECTRRELLATTVAQFRSA